jgi:carboxymethylenebutenolidase
MMGQTITLKAADGHSLQAYRADPAGKPKGGLVVAQEIFGVNNHMRQVCDEFAKRGYAAIAPCLFDRAERNIELGYAQDDILRGRAIRGKISFDQTNLDVAAARDALKGAGKLGVIGYCWGGSVAWLAALRLDGFACAVAYYGGNLAEYANEKPRCPVQCHFGDADAGIPMSDVGKLRGAQGAIVEIQVYPAGHGFSCDERASFHKPSHERAPTRTLAFFAEHIG